MQSLWTPARPALKLREGLLVPGHRTNWHNCGQKHGETRFRIRAMYPDRGAVTTNYLFRYFIDDPEDAEEFWHGLTGQMPGLPDLPRPSWFPQLEDYPGLIYEFATVTFLTTTGAGTYSKPVDWNNANNSGECISAASGTDAASAFSGNGGYGGGYSLKSNLTILSSNNYSVGAGGAAAAGDGGSTWFGGTNLATCLVGATGGSQGNGSGNSYGTPVGTTIRLGGSASLGGAGSAGPNGNGQDGRSGTTPGGGWAGGGNGGGINGTSGTSTTGGNGGDNSGGTGHGVGHTTSTAGGAGSNGGGGGGGGPTGAGGAGSLGTEWDGTHGSGGGGGSSGINSGGSGVAAGGAVVGFYGAGAGIGTAGIAGAQGIIVVTYTPAAGVLFNRWPQLGPILAQ